MQDEHTQDRDLIDLGAATDGTKGAMEGAFDMIGFIIHDGLTED